MMNQMTLFHSSPSDFLHAEDECTNESIDTYKEYKQLLEEYSDEHSVLTVVDQFCKMVSEDDDHFIFFKPFCSPPRAVITMNMQNNPAITVNLLK